MVSCDDSAGRLYGPTEKTLTMMKYLVNASIQLQRLRRVRRKNLLRCDLCPLINANIASRLTLAYEGPLLQTRLVIILAPR